MNPFHPGVFLITMSWQGPPDGIAIHGIEKLDTSGLGNRSCACWPAGIGFHDVVFFRVTIEFQFQISQSSVIHTLKQPDCLVQHIIIPALLSQTAYSLPRGPLPKLARDKGHERLGVGIKIAIARIEVRIGAFYPLLDN
jgi:hypothetical protein